MMVALAIAISSSALHTKPLMIWGLLLLFGNLLKHAPEALEQGSGYVVPELNGTEVKNLSPPYRIAAAVPQYLSPAQKMAVDKPASEHAFFSQSGEQKKYLSLPFRRGAQAPGRHQQEEVTLDQVKSSRMQDACRAANATVTVAFSAAIPMVLRDLVSNNVHQGELYYRCDLLRNLRQFCAAPFSSSEHPVAASQTTLPIGSLLLTSGSAGYRPSRGSRRTLLPDRRRLRHAV